MKIENKNEAQVAQQNFKEKLNLSAEVLAAILAIGRAQSAGLTGRDEVDFLRFGLIKEITEESQQPITQLKNELNSLFFMFPKTGTVFLPHQKKKTSPVYVPRHFMRVRELDEPKEQAFVDTLSTDDRNDLLRYLMMTSNYVSESGMHVAVDFCRFWLERRYVLKELKAIIDTPTCHDLLVTSRKAAEMGSLSLFDDDMGAEE